MKRSCLAAFLACLSLAFAAQAQEPKKPEAAPEKPAAGAAEEPAAKPGPKPGDTPDPQIFEGILNCLAAGMTPDWKKAWFVVREIDRDEGKAVRQFQGDFYYATKETDHKGKRVQTCGAERIIAYVGALNDYLTPDQKGWTSVSFTFLRDGKYDVKYDYTPVKPKPAAKPAAKASSKKKQEAPK
jgi:hypothetical protein